MTYHTDTHSLYVLIVSLLGTVISLPVVALHRSRLCCAWSRCLNDLLEEWTPFATDSLGLRRIKHATE